VGEGGRQRSLSAYLPYQRATGFQAPSAHECFFLYPSMLLTRTGVEERKEKKMLKSFSLKTSVVCVAIGQIASRLRRMIKFRNIFFRKLYAPP
jgi:hypothetical protein